MEFTYVGYTDTSQVVKGKISAGNEEAASDTLSRLGYRVLALKPVSKISLNMTLIRPKVKSNELVAFSRQLALLLNSGIGIIHCLELLGDQSADAELKRVLKEIVPELRAGSTLAEAMDKYRNAFSRMYTRMVEVGERTGSLDTILRNLADYIEKESRSIAKVKSAMMYPIVVLIVAVVVAFVLVGFVLPPVLGMFEGLGAKIPLPTQLLINLVDFVSGNLLAIAGTMIAVVVAVMVYIRTPAGSMQWNKLKLKIPLLGRILHVSELAKSCRSMSLLFRAGLPVNDIINLTSQASGNKAIAKGLMEVGQDAMAGKGLSKPMADRPAVFLPLMTELATVGEETGNLEETLVMIAENFEAEAEIKTGRLLTMIEPMMTIVMGIVVAFLAVSIFLPIYSSLQYIK